MSPNLAELAKIFLRLGATAFGGPLAHIALMRQEFVERRSWMTDAEFLDLNSAVNLIPGPNSTELAMHIGHRRAGHAGLWVAGACFIAPAMFLVLLLAWVYKNYGTMPAARAVLWGVGPVVVAIVAQALWKFAPAALKNWPSRIVAAGALIASWFGIGEVALIFLAAGVGLILAMLTPGKSPSPGSPEPPAEQGAPPSKMLLLGPIAVLPGVAPIFWSFLKMGFVVYGSGYVLLAYLRAELVENTHWITDQQLLDAIAVGQVTPGPVFTTATFLGYQMAGVPGALAATAGIFGPSFLLVGLLASFLNRFSGSPKLRAFLDCVNAASFALMFVVTMQLAANTILPSGKLDVISLCLAVLSLGVLLLTKVNSAILLALGAVLGFVFHQGI